MPSVVEAMQATAALRHGALNTLFPDAPAPILEGAMLGMQAFNLYEADRMKRASRKGE